MCGGQRDEVAHGEHVGHGGRVLGVEAAGGMTLSGGHGFGTGGHEVVGGSGGHGFGTGGHEVVGGAGGHGFGNGGHEIVGGAGGHGFGTGGHELVGGAGGGNAGFLQNPELSTLLAQPVFPPLLLPLSEEHLASCFFSFCSLSAHSRPAR